MNSRKSPLHTVKQKQRFIMFDEDYETLIDLNRDLIELMYETRNPVSLPNRARHPLEDIVFTYDEVMAVPVRIKSLAASFGLYVPENPQETSKYFYMALKSILYGEAHNKYPSYLPSVGEMYHFTRNEFNEWKTRFWNASKKEVPSELLYRLSVDEIFADRMTVFMYFSTKNTDQDPFFGTRISHNGEKMNFEYIEEEKG